MPKTDPEWGHVPVHISREVPTPTQPPPQDVPSNGVTLDSWMILDTSENHSMIVLYLALH